MEIQAEDLSVGLDEVVIVGAFVKVGEILVKKKVDMGGHGVGWIILCMFFLICFWYEHIYV